MAASECCDDGGTLTSGGISSKHLKRSSCRHFFWGIPAGTCQAWEPHALLSWKNASGTQCQRNKANKIVSLWVAVEKGQSVRWSSS